MPFTARQLSGGGTTIVELSGEVDPDSAPRLQAALEAAIRTGRPVIIDITDVTFMDSTGFGLLIAAHLRAKRVGVPVLLRALSGRIRGLMQMLGLDAVLEIETETSPGRNGHRADPITSS